MSEYLNTIDNLPDISFIDELTLQDVQSQLLTFFTEKYKEITGKKIQLSKADPYRIMMLGCAQLIYQGMQHVDKGGKMNFLKYAYGDYLENVVALKKVIRNPAKYAKVPLKFTLSEKRETVTSIPIGTRVTAAYEVYFATIEYAEIPAGEIEVTVLAQCTEAGEIGNDYAVGEINTLVDSIGFISSVKNIESSTGGTEIENDQDMAERAYLAPSSYSTAGPDEAYEYLVRESGLEIGDIKVKSPTAGVVDIRFVMKNGDIPDDATVTLLQEYIMSQRKRRPLTDNVQVQKPIVEQYEIDVIYYINMSDSNSATSIQKQVEDAVNDYRVWQDSKIGRDINPDELIMRIKRAGAKRAIIAYPFFCVVGDVVKAQCCSVKIAYGGLEND